MEGIVLFSIDHCDGASKKVIEQLEKIKIVQPCVAFVEQTRTLTLRPEKETNISKKNFWKKIIFLLAKKGCDVVPLRIEQKKKFFMNPDSLSNALINMQGEINDVKIILRTAFKKKQKIALIGGTHAERVAKLLKAKGINVKVIRTREPTVIRQHELSAKKAISNMQSGKPSPRFISSSWAYKITGTALKKMKLRFEQVEKDPVLWKKYNVLCDKIRKVPEFALGKQHYKKILKKQQKELLRKRKIIEKEFNKRFRIDHPIIQNTNLRLVYNAQGKV